MSNSPFPQSGPIPSAIGADARVSAFLRSVYGWMFFGLAVTAVVATFVAGSPTMVKKIESISLTGKGFKKIEPTDEGIKQFVAELIEDHTW